MAMRLWLTKDNVSGRDILLGVAITRGRLAQLNRRLFWFVGKPMKPTKTDHQEKNVGFGDITYLVRIIALFTGLYWLMFFLPQSYRLLVAFIKEPNCNRS